MAKALINLPPKAKRGAIIEIKALVAHPMETGYRTDSDGKLVPRDIINRFVCSFEGETVFSAELFPAITANPYIAFTTIARKSGSYVFTWTDDEGQSDSHSAAIEIEE